MKFVIETVVVYGTMKMYCLEKVNRQPERLNRLEELYDGICKNIERA